MNEDWLHKVHDRMTDYEIDEPENLWDAIESKRAETSSASRPVMLWVRRSMVAAAMIAVMISLGIYFTIRRDVPEPGLLTEATDNAVRGSENHLQEPVAHYTVPGLSPGNLIVQNRIPFHAPGEESAVTSVSTEIQTETADKQPEAGEEPGRPDDAPEPDGRMEKETFSTVENIGYLASVHARPSSSNNISVSVYSSGGTGSALNYNSHGDAFAAAGPDASSWKDNPLLGILVFNQGKDIETDIKHRLPIRAGITVAYNLGKRFGIETGLSYTNLTSDIKEGSDSHYSTGEQRLHYIGIPLNLKYRMLSWKRFDLYASAGALAEKCISAKLHKEFILDRQKKDSETENLSDKPMQWSANASVGVQFNFLNSMSVFVEPGISYYFDDGTDIQTIYKEKPLNFNLNMGLRFTFGK